MENNNSDRRVLVSFRLSTLVIIGLIMCVVLVSIALIKNHNHSTKVVEEVAEVNLVEESTTTEENVDNNQIEVLEEENDAPIVVALNEDTAVTVRQLDALTSRSISGKERENFLLDESTDIVDEELINPEPEVVTTPIEDVTISVDMDLTVRTGLSREDFISLMARVPADTAGFFEENAGLIYDMCEKYELNEIFFCGLISAESGWTIAGNHRRTHNYISLMSSGGLISYSSLESGMETAAKTLHERYLSEGGSCYYGKTLSAMKTRFCPGSSTWVGLVYGRMQQIINAK